jgi:putative ABC transport system permease protein
MSKNYLMIALRHIKRSKGYSFINIAGLAIGMTCCIMIMLWVQDELSFDRYHENADRIYRLTVDANLGAPLRAPVSNAISAPTLVGEYPEVLSAARIERPGRASVKYGDIQFYEENVGYADNSIFEVFTFPMISGDPKSALSTAYTVVITEEMAEKYFGDEDPIGKILKFDGETDHTVTGVVENVPSNSHFTFDMLRSFETLYMENREEMEQGMRFRYFTYLLLADNADYRELEQKLPTLVETQLGPVINSLGGSMKFLLQPLTSIHLHSDMGYDLSANGNIAHVYLFAAIALFILLIACFNFINLSTARSASRAKEVGIRKTFGAARNKLIRQFLGESVIYSVLAIFLSSILLELSLPLFNSLAGRELSFHYLQTPWFIPGLLLFALAVGFVAGFYPAFFLSSFQPVRVLQGGLKAGLSNSRFRSVLVLIQFAISITLIIGTITIYNQLYFMKNKKLGFNKKQVVVIPGIDDTIRQSLSTLKEELAAVPGVLHVAASSRVPGRGVMKGVLRPEGFSEDQPVTMDLLTVDPDFLPTMGIELAAGRNFSNDLASDTTDAVIINQAAARKIGWDDPIGKKFIFTPPPGSETPITSATVVGVVKDFHISSLHQRIEPLFVDYALERMSTITVKIAPDNISGTLELLKSKWEGIVPNKPFDYQFLDETFDSQYRSEERMGNIALSFSLLAIFIGCLGLFGMSAFSAEQRTKEIGIRRVLGASVTGIVGLLSKEFLMLVAIANLIAWPIAYYAMDKWLQDFAYRIDIGLGIFIPAGIAALLIALVTISFQATKAALNNPIDSLRYE